MALPKYLETSCCFRGCGRLVTPKDNLSQPICEICRNEILSGKSVYRAGFLIDLPDEIRRYDRDGEVKVAVYHFKGRPVHTDPVDAPEVSWKQFVKHLLHSRDFNGSWRLWIFRNPDACGDGAGICMDSSYVAAGVPNSAYVRIKDGRVTA